MSKKYDDLKDLPKNIGKGISKALLKTKEKAKKYFNSKRKKKVYMKKGE